MEALLARCGFASSGLYVTDASRRSAQGNAFFSGFGRLKRIALFDTLLDKHPGAEVEAVLAHEPGHYKMRHVLTGIVRSAVILFAGLFVVGWLSRQPWLLPAFGIGARDDALVLVVCVLAGPLLGVAGNCVSRRHEFQADVFARRLVGAGLMVAALQRLVLEMRASCARTRCMPWSPTATARAHAGEATVAGNVRAGVTAPGYLSW